MAVSGSILWPLNTLEGQERRDTARAPDPGVLVQGTVVDHTAEVPVPGATVSLGSGPSGVRGRGTRVTDDEGRFRFQGVPEGTYRLYASAPGYRRMADTLQVPAGRDLELVLPLSEDPIRLEPIIVTAEREYPVRRGWEGRRRTGSGFVITREEIEERRPRLVTELLNRVPGGIVVATPPHGYTLLLRGQCRPGIWVDGVEVSYVDSIDQLLSPHDVAAIEVFHGFDLPVEFGTNACGGVLIWTRMGTPGEGGDASIRDLVSTAILAAALVVTMFFLSR